MFQFHYGTIGALISDVVAGIIEVFQFHYGTIGATGKTRLFDAFTVSIPLWYDWGNYHIAFPVFVTLLTTIY
jgi:hypothetical protein